MPLNSFIPQELLVLLASLCGALTVASLVARLRVQVGPAPARALADYLEAGHVPDPVENMGQWLLQRLPTLQSVGNVDGHRRWLALVGPAPSLAGTLGLAALLAVSGILLALVSGVPLAGLLAVLGGVYPFLRLRGYVVRWSAPCPNSRR